MKNPITKIKQYFIEKQLKNASGPSELEELKDRIVGSSKARRLHKTARDLSDGLEYIAVLDGIYDAFEVPEESRYYPNPEDDVPIEIPFERH